MSHVVALLVLALLGFAFGFLLFAEARHDGEWATIGIPYGIGLMIIAPAIGAVQHFVVGWAWWSVVIPAHALTIAIGVILFNFAVWRTARDVSESSTVGSRRTADESAEPTNGAPLQLDGASPKFDKRTV